MDEIAERALLVFELSPGAYAIPMRDVQEIVFMAALSRPAGTAPVLSGFLNVGGTAYPVVDMRRLLEMPERLPDLHTPLIILRGGLALQVDRVRRVERVQASEVVAVEPSQSLNGCLEGILGDVHLLSSEHLLLRQERERIETLRRREQDRLLALDA